MPPTAGKFPDDYGRSKGRRDMERIGLFSEQSFLTVKPTKEPPERGTGMQLIANGPKTKTALSDCYFDKTPFKSIAEKLPYMNLYKLEKKRDLEEAKKNITPQFWPASGNKISSTRGDFYGTFGGRVDAFSPVKRPRGPYKSELPNIQTRPVKQGSYGYPDITINKFPPYKEDGPEPSPKFGSSGDKTGGRAPFYVNMYPKPVFEKNPYIPVGPSGSLYVKRRVLGDEKPTSIWYPPHIPKWPANNHDGCFDQFPKHMPEPYGGDKNKRKALSGDTGPKFGIFYRPIPGCDRRHYVESVVNINADFRVNQRNWRFVKAITYKDIPE